jgi:hypothetical protein
MNRRLFLLAILALPHAFAAEPAASYPFEVFVGGHKAVVTEAIATVPEPVANDAVISIAAKAPALIVNVFHSKRDGTILSAAPVIVIVATDASQVKLGETLDGNSLDPGTYLLNVVAHGKTSKVVFTVSDRKPE